MRVGIVVGRFQTHTLHVGHEALLETARQNSDHLIVFLGVSAIAGTKRNPLDYATRHMMINTHLRSQSPLFSYNIEPIKDVESNSEWSQALDMRIRQHIKYGDEVTLYGGEDSFLNCYTGEFKSHERLNMPINHRATQMRQKIVQQPPVNSLLFRQGALYAIGNMRDVVSCTVDVACVKDDHVLVGRKAGETAWRLPGGFVDATDADMIAAARREFSEETGLSIEGSLHYVGSKLVDDWRFRNSPDKAVMTTLFACKYNFGNPVAADDLVEVKWLPWIGAMDKMNHGHQHLYTMLYGWMRTKAHDAF